MTRTRKSLLGIVAALALAAGLAALPTVESTYQLSQIYRLGPNWVNNNALAAGVAETLTVPAAVPASRRLTVTFSGTCVATGFYVRFGGTATIPAADLTDGSGSIFNPIGFKVAQGSTISVIAVAACQLGHDYQLEDVTQ